ncbi:PHP domain-containing protein [Candidatus Bathyarchaeota archaeon]|nr:MAG: PHP domain-containing protein [Candidatus Bathyarchaeota archaeon]
MIIDLHVHSRCSDGVFTVEEIIREAKARGIGLLSITDHDSISCQGEAVALAKKSGIHYVTGVELKIIFSHPEYRCGRPVSLDLLGYRFDIEDEKLRSRLLEIKRYREERAAKILEKINRELEKEGIEKLTKEDFEEIRASVGGVIGRPHIADHLVRKGIVKNRQEAFDRYLVKCNVPNYPVYPEEASKLIRNAGGITVLAHPNDPRGISLAELTKSLREQTRIIEESFLEYIDGVECWHPRHDARTTSHYVRFARRHGLIMTGGSDCHQKPVVMGTVKVPSYVAEQFI